MSEQGGAGIWGLLAEFSGPETLAQGARGVREAGVASFDLHSPYPVHGMDEAAGLPRSRVPLFVLVLGLGGAAAGMLLQWWVSAVDYPLVISDKPFFSWPAFVPIMFEIGVLGGAVGALVGLLHLARLPRHHHPLFNMPSFERVTDDGFFLSVEAADPKFDIEGTADLLRRLGARNVETVPLEADG